MFQKAMSLKSWNIADAEVNGLRGDYLSLWMQKNDSCNLRRAGRKNQSFFTGPTLSKISH